MEWTELKSTVADAQARINACFAVCDIIERDGQFLCDIDLNKAFNQDGAAYKDLEVVRTDVEKLCNYFIGNGKIDITNELKGIQNDLTELSKRRIDQQTATNYFVLLCWGTVRIITDCFKDKQSNSMEDSNTCGNILPDRLCTERAEKAVLAAIKAEYIEKTDNGLTWIPYKMKRRGGKAQLAYFCVKAWCPKNSDKLPLTELQKLFGVSRLDSAVNGNLYSKEQKWEPEIDKLFS